LSLAILCVGLENSLGSGPGKNENVIAQRLKGVPRQQAGRVCDQLISAAGVSGAARNFSWHSQPAAFAPHAIIRLVAAVLAEQNDEWTESRRYMGLDILTACRKTGRPDMGSNNSSEARLTIEAIPA